MSTSPNLLQRLQNHRAMMAPHQKERQAGRLLIEAMEEIEALREALSDIGTIAHCISLSGPANTPTLADAWTKFDRIAVKATHALTAPKNSANE